MEGELSQKMSEYWMDNVYNMGEAMCTCGHPYKAKDTRD